MHLEQIPLRLQKLSEQRELSYSLAAPASDEEIFGAEQRLGCSFPAQVKLFYRSFNGLRVDEPKLEIFPIERLSFASPIRLHFTTLEGSRQLYFDVSHINEQNNGTSLPQMVISSPLTMASFWTNKIWAWVERRSAIWQEWQDETLYRLET